jgi:hypothetical protein
VCIFPGAKKIDIRLRVTSPPIKHATYAATGTFDSSTTSSRGDVHSVLVCLVGPSLSTSKEEKGEKGDDDERCDSTDDAAHNGAYITTLG